MQQPNLGDYENGKTIDKRMRLAGDFFDENPTGTHKIHKTTRAGATTALIAESINRRERMLVLQPHNRILDEAVLEKAKGYSNRKDANVVKTLANRHCPYNVKRCEEHPDLKHLDVLPVHGGCGPDCEYFEVCSVMAPVRERWDVCGCNYHKLMTIMAAPKSAKRNSDTRSQADLLKFELMTAKNILVDEAHVLASGERKEWILAVLSEENDIESEINRLVKEASGIISRYENIGVDYIAPHRCATAFGSILKDADVHKAMREVAQRAREKGSSKQKLSVDVENGYCIVDDTKNAAMFFNGLVSLMLARNTYGLSVSDVVSLQNMYAFTTSKKIAISARWDRRRRKVVVKASALSNHIPIFLKEFIKEAQWGAYKDRDDLRIIMTSATFPDHDYNQYVHRNTPFTDHMWGMDVGMHGDPMGTNRKLKVLTDTKRYQDWGKGKPDIGGVARFVIDTVEEYGIENVGAIAISAERANEINKAIMKHAHDSKYEGIVDYYRSDRTMGVQSKKRILIAVGAAYPAANTYDPVATSPEESKRMLREAMRTATCQAWGRVKDPQGKEPSLVFALYCTEEECKDIFAWGKGRALDVEGRPHCDDPVCMPEIVRCEDWSVMKERAKSHLNPLKHMILEKIDICYRQSGTNQYQENPQKINFDCNGEISPIVEIHIREKRALTITDVDFSPMAQYKSLPDLYTHDTLSARFDYFVNGVVGRFFVSGTRTYGDLKKFLMGPFHSRWDAWGWQRPKIGYNVCYGKPDNAKKTFPLSWVPRHILGATMSMSVYPLDRDGNGVWGAFDIDAHRCGETGVEYIKKRYAAEEKARRLCETMDYYSIPYCLEQSGGPSSYHIWLFFERVHGRFIRAFLESIAIEADVDIDSVEILPKHTHYSTESKKVGNGLRLPFGVHQEHGGKSTVAINGEWVDAKGFNGITIKTIDISQIDPDMPELETIEKPKRTRKSTEAIYPDIGGTCTDENGIEYGTVNINGGIRPLIQWLRSQVLGGPESVNARLVIAREHLNAGKSCEDVARLFVGQPKYNYEKSLEHVRRINEVKCKNVGKDKLWEMIPNFCRRYVAETGNSVW